MTEAPEKEVLLSVRNIGVTFGRGNYAFHAVRGVSFDIYRGETLDRKSTRLNSSHS